MFKLLGNFVDSQDKELNRLRKIVGAVNAEIEGLLTAQLAALAALQADLHELLHRQSNAGRALPGLLHTAVAATIGRADALTAEAAELRQVIERGEVTTRRLNVLLADSRQLAQFLQELARRTGDRTEIEQNIAELSARVTADLRELAADREALAAVASRLPALDDSGARPPTPDELVKLVDTAATDLGPEVAAYFHRMQDLLAGLRDTTALLALLGETPLAGGAAANAPRGPHPLEGSRADQAKLAEDLDRLRESARALVAALHENDLMKHLERQGLLLPGELQAAVGPLPGAQAASAGGSGRGGVFWRRRAPAPPPPPPGGGSAGPGPAAQKQ